MRQSHAFLNHRVEVAVALALGGQRFILVERPNSKQRVPWDLDTRCCEVDGRLRGTTEERGADL